MRPPRREGTWRVQWTEQYNHYKSDKFTTYRKSKEYHSNHGWRQHVEGLLRRAVVRVNSRYISVTGDIEVWKMQGDGTWEQIDLESREV